MSAPLPAPSIARDGNGATRKAAKVHKNDALVMSSPYFLDVYQARPIQITVLLEDSALLEHSEPLSVRSGLVVFALRDKPASHPIRVFLVPYRLSENFA